MTETGTQTRRERLEKRETAIVSAAHDVFAEHGFDGAKMTDIARGADVAEGTIYLYFRNKNALLQAVVSKFYDRLTAGADAGVAKVQGTFERLEFLARHHLVNCLAEWRILELAIGLYRFMPDYASDGHYKLNKAYVAVFDGVIREAGNRHDIRNDIPLWVIRDLFYGSLEYSARTQVLRGRPDNIDFIVTNLMTIIRQGIGVSGNEKRADGTRNLVSIAERLEAITERLEKTS